MEKIEPMELQCHFKGAENQHVVSRWEIRCDFRTDSAY
jgi:hypothetical protein